MPLVSETAGRIPVGQKGGWSLFTPEMKFTRWCDLPSRSYCVREATDLCPSCKKSGCRGDIHISMPPWDSECTPVCMVLLETIVPLFFRSGLYSLWCLGKRSQANHIHIAKVWGSSDSNFFSVGSPGVSGSSLSFSIGEPTESIKLVGPSHHLPWWNFLRQWGGRRWRLK